MPLFKDPKPSDLRYQKPNADMLPTTPAVPVTHEEDKGNLPLDYGTALPKEQLSPFKNMK